MMMFSAAISAGLVIPLFALQVEWLGASLAFVGIIIFSREGVSTFSRIPVGGLSDRFGRKPVILFGTAGYMISPLAYSLINNPLYLIPFTMFHGISISAIWTTAFAAVSDMTEAGKRGQAMGLFSLVPSTGFSLGIVVGGFLSKGDKFILTDRISFILGLTAFILCLVGFKETHIPEARNQHPTENNENSMETTIRLFKNPKLLLVSIAALAGSLTLAMSLTFFPIYGNQIGLGADQIGLILFAQSFIGLTIIAPIIGKLSDMVDKVVLLLSILIPSFLIVALIPLFDNFWIFMFFFTYLGIEETGIQIIPTALIAESEDVPAKGLGIGVIQTSNHIGRAVSPLLFSLLAGTASIAYAFWGSAIIAGLLLLVMYPIVRRIGKSSMPTKESSDQTAIE